MADVVPTIKYYRGDVYPKVITFTNKATGLPVDLTGMTVTLTVNTEKDPVDATNQLFQVAGVIAADPKTGVVSFTPAVGDNDMVKAKYYFDVEATITTVFKKTLMKGYWIITQDINKD
jgi:hypothetical protein